MFSLKRKYLPLWLYLACLSGATFVIAAFGSIVGALAWRPTAAGVWVWAIVGSVGVGLALLLIYRQDAMTLTFWLIGVSAMVTLILIGVAQQLRSETLTSLVTLVSFAVPLIATAVSNHALPSVGDAARYLNNHPDNEVENREVRRIIIDRIKQLHEVSDQYGPVYSRIVVIGHSLGSVIAYDALKHYWAEVNKHIDVSGHSARDACEVLEQRAARLLETGGPDEYRDALNDYRLAQWELCKTLDGSVGSRWIVSDFITMGSPLSHLDFLTGGADDPDDPGGVTSDLYRKVREREYPTSPPVRQTASPARYEDLRASPHLLRFPRGPERFLHQAALFAPTRWTNLYFSHDIVGGPLGPLLGSGVLDVDLGGPPVSPWAFLRDSPHSSYWLDDRHGGDGARLSLSIVRGLVERPIDEEDSIPHVSLDALVPTETTMKRSRSEWHGNTRGLPTFAWRRREE